MTKYKLIGGPKDGREFEYGPPDSDMFVTYWADEGCYISNGPCTGIETEISLHWTYEVSTIPSAEDCHEL